MEDKITAVILGDVSALTIEKTTTTTETLTLEQIEATIENIVKELANVQDRLDYQLGLKAQLEK